jgi:membrane fusion protein, multidrug efflux system
MIRNPLPCAALLLALPLLAGCPGKPKEEEKKEEAALPVEIATVTVGPIEAAYRGTATLEAEDEATVMAKTVGVVEQILVEEGDRVRAGQTLARLETDRLRLEVARARAEAEKARENYERNTRIYEKNLISKELYDQSRFTLDAARAAYDLAKLTLQESEIKAPFAGIVSARHIKAGNLIQPNTPTFRITKMDQLHAHIYVPERDIHKLAPKQPATLVVDAWPERLFQGSILRVNPVVDAGSGTVKVTVAVAPGQPELKPGMFGRVQILYDRRDQAMLVDKDAVLTEDAAHSVFVVREGRARRTAVRLGYADATHYEILEGVEAGDQVVTTGQVGLKDDAKVEVVNAPAVDGAGGAQAQAATAAATE